MGIRYFVLVAISLAGLSLEANGIKEVFTHIFTTRAWGPETISGEDFDQTNTIREKIPQLLEMFHIHTILDAACGDFSWMLHVDLHDAYYLGMDIVQDLIARNQKLYQTDKVRFVEGNIVTDFLPKVDLIICRSCFIHLNFKDIKQAITNFKRSGSRYLLTTTFSECSEHEDGETGGSRPINLQLAPFKFPPPLVLINEGCTLLSGTRKDKSLGLWLLEDLPSYCK